MVSSQLISHKKRRAAELRGAFLALSPRLDLVDVDSAGTFVSVFDVE